MKMIEIEQHLNLVHSIASKRYIQFKHKYDYDDLFQLGCIGLMNSINDFDENKGFKFSTYAYHCIDGAILRMIRDDKWYGNNRKERFQSSGPCSLNAIANTDNKNLYYIDLIGSRDRNFEDIELNILINRLPEKFKKIIKMLHFEGYSQKEAAKKFNCSQVSISRLNKQALNELKHQLSKDIYINKKSSLPGAEQLS